MKPALFHWTCFLFMSHPRSLLLSGNFFTLRPPMRINSGHTNVDEVILPCTGTVWAPEIILCDPPHVSPLQMVGIDSSTTDIFGVLCGIWQSHRREGCSVPESLWSHLSRNSFYSYTIYNILHKILYNIYNLYYITYKGIQLYNFCYSFP